VKQHKGGTPKRKSAKKRNLGKYKSGLEKTCADLLRESGIKFAYETEEFVLVDKFRYDGTYFKMTAKGKDLSDRSNAIVLPIRYTPDFLALDGSWIIETKGYTPSHHDFPMRWKLFLRHLMDLDKPAPALFICKNRHQIAQAIEVIKKLDHGKGANKGAAGRNV
tara:strand:+ start:2348 stop:2839 length:492 start_codon:yes stop_codon:yes gene_type:complete